MIYCTKNNNASGADIKITKKFSNGTVLFLIGGIMGVVQQFLGGHNLELIMGNLGLYATIIILLILRDRQTKEQFRDIFLFFLGLDLFYYMFLFFLDLSVYFEYNQIHPDNNKEITYFFQRSFGGISEFIYWTIIATAASFWGFFAVKFRLKEYKKRYHLMLMPLIAVLLIEIIKSMHNFKYYYLLLISDFICFLILAIVFIQKQKKQNSTSISDLDL